MAQTWSGVIHSYRPGSDFLLHTDHLLYGYNAGGYHVTNYLLHFFTTFMLFFTTKQLLLPFYYKEVVSKYAFVASLIFLFYPFHSECIFWLVGRSSLLAVLFAMASVYCFLRKNENNGWYALSLLCLMFGLFSYESIWTFPIIIILLTYVYDKGLTLKARLLYVSGYWLTFFTYLIARFYLTTTVIGSPYGTQKIVSFDIVFLLRNGASLIGRSFVPPMQSAAAFVVCLVVVAIVIAFVLIKLREHITTPMIIMALAYLLCLLPVISLGIDTHDTESERFLYMPSAFLSMLLALVLIILFKKNTAYATGVLLTIQIIFIVISYTNFLAASKVTKVSVQALQSLHQTSSIYCINLPGQYRGGFIFRNGIASAARLFAPKVKQVNIVSQQELYSYPKEYQLYIYDVRQLPKQQKAISKSLTTNAGTAVFIWTDNSLNIFR